MSMITLLICCIIEPPQSVPATPLVPMKAPAVSPKPTNTYQNSPTAVLHPGWSAVLRKSHGCGKLLPKLLLESWRGEPVDVNNNPGKSWSLTLGNLVDRAALPKNVEMAKKYSDQPFVLVGI